MILQEEGIELNAVTGDGVANRAKFFERMGRKAQELSSRTPQIRSGRVQLHVGEFPQARIQRAGGALTDQQATAAFEYERRKATSRRSGARRQAGQFIDAILAPGDAEALQRAASALRSPWRADQGAELHQGLV